MNKEHTINTLILWTLCQLFENYSETFLKLKKDFKVLLNIVVCIISYPSGVLAG